MATFCDELEITDSQIDGGAVYVISDADIVVGYYALFKIDTSSVELQHLFVDPDYLKRGFGSKLLEHAIENSRAGGYRQLIIQGDPNATGFYQKHGIPVVKEVRSSIPGRTIPWMELQL